MSTHANFVGMTVSGTPGTGTITLNAAAGGGARTFFAAFGAVSTTVDIQLEDPAGTVVGCERNATYNGGNPGTITRGTPETPGSLVSLTSAAVVRVALPATKGNRLENALQALTPGGRLTTESGVPVSTSDRTAQSTLYYTPYVHNIITLWDGADWVPITFSEVSKALGTLSNNTNYDVFGFLSSGVLDIEFLAWTNNTTRATDVTLQDGRYAKSGDKTRLYLGTFRTTSTTTTEDSGFHSTSAARKRLVWNAYNRVRRQMSIEENQASWTFTGNGTWRQVRAQSDNQCEWVCGLEAQAHVRLEANLAIGVNAASSYMATSIGYDSTSSPTTAYQTSFYSSGPFAVEGGAVGCHAAIERPAELGYHYGAWLETFGGQATQMTSYGTNAVARFAAMTGWVEA